MRHKVLACLEAADEKRQLSGVMQADEIYFPLSFKGCRDPEVKPPRRKGPKKRGLCGNRFAFLARSILIATLSPVSPSLGKTPRLPCWGLLPARSPTAPQSFPTPIPLTKSSANEADSGMSNCLGERAKGGTTSKPSTATMPD